MKKVAIIIFSTVFLACGQSTSKHNYQNSESTCLESEENVLTAQNEIQKADNWNLLFIKSISNETPDDIELKEEELTKFGEMSFSFLEDTLIANGKYKALIVRNTIDTRKFFGRDYLYNFYVDFLHENLNIYISKELHYLTVRGIDKESIDFLKFLNRINLDDPSPIIEKNMLIVSYSRHILVFGKEEKQRIHSHTQSALIHESNGNYKILDGDCNIEGHEDWSCDGTFRYVPLTTKENIQIILVPMDCGDFSYRYYLLTIKDNKIISDLYVEGEWYEDFNSEELRNKEFTSFEIDVNYNIIVTTKWEKEDILASGGIKTYRITDNGKIVEIKQ